MEINKFYLVSSILMAIMLLFMIYIVVEMAYWRGKIEGIREAKKIVNDYTEKLKAQQKKVGE